MKFDIKIDTRELENKLHVLAREARVAPGLVIKEESRFIAESLAKLTPPKTQAQGRKAVANDMANVVTALPNESGPERIWGPLNRLANARKTAAIEKLLASWKSKPRFTTAPADIKAEHLKKRTSYGRVRSRARLMAYANHARKYLREVQSRVGWTKSWLANILTATGGSAANWFARHAAQAGYVVANFGEEKPGITATAFNIKIPRYQRMVDAAVRNRERVTQTKIDRIVAGKATNLGFTVVNDRS